MKSSVARPGSGRVGRLVAVTVAGLCLAVACSSSPSYSDLSKIVRAVPVPAGLTYVSEARSADAAFPDPNKDFSVEYSNTTMTCDQLSAAWIAALNKAHVKYDPVPAGSLGIYVKNSRARVDRHGPAVHSRRLPPSVRGVGAEAVTRW